MYSSEYNKRPAMNGGTSYTQIHCAISLAPRQRRGASDIAQWRAVPAVVLVARATSHNSGYTTCPSEHANARPATSYIRAPLYAIQKIFLFEFMDILINFL